MAEIRALGRLPQRKSKPVGDKQVAENYLAIRFSKAKANNQLSEEQIAELDTATQRKYLRHLLVFGGALLHNATTSARTDMHIVSE